MIEQQFWHNLVTDRSFAFLQELRKRFSFVLIGGWAVYLYTRALKSKDIDIVVNFETLGNIRSAFELVKNERLKKYEIREEGFDVDIYVPHWSKLGLPIEYVMKHTVSIDGFVVPKPDVLFALKLFAYRDRKSSLKGRKDMIDVIGLLHAGGADPSRAALLLESHGLVPLLEELRGILKTTTAMPELDLNQKRFADFKKKVLEKL